MKTNRLILPLVAALAASILNGCGTVGPNSIKFGRNDYNEVLHGTSGNQLLLNLVRIHNHEPPLFIEVTEIDAAVQIQTNVTGTISQIGAHPGSAGGTLSGQLASVGGNATYTEAPIIRYQPLQGAPLIAQLNKPISVDSLVYMFDSDWPLDTFLPLVIDRIAPGGSENYSTVMRAILALNNNNALIIEATQSGQTEGAATGQSSKKSTAIAPQPNAGKQENNALTLYFDPKGLSNGNFKCQSDLEDSGLNIIRVSVGRWLYLLKIYRPKDIPADVNVTDAHIVSASLAELQRIFSKLPTTIEIPTKSFSGQNHERKAPLLHARSALGVIDRPPFGGPG